MQVDANAIGGTDAQLPQVISHPVRECREFAVRDRVVRLLNGRMTGPNLGGRLQELVERIQGTHDLCCSLRSTSAVMSANVSRLFGLASCASNSMPNRCSRNVTNLKVAKEWRIPPRINWTESVKFSGISPGEILGECTA